MNRRLRQYLRIRRGSQFGQPPRLGRSLPWV